MQYNSGRYNEHQYNNDFYSLSLLESLSESDTISKSISIVKTETESLADTHILNDTMSALLETLSSSDIRLMLPYLTEVETLALSATFSPLPEKLCAEILNLSASLTSDVATVLIEFIFFNSDIRVEITNKSLQDQVRLNDWLELRKPFVEYWHD
jgi:hypothetical protein